ncbi:MAG: thioredoxin-disulfide reductase [Candidatus Omnitrophota bacterium]|nr:thioredoxin-disulfide reductase [Candidatus Omnitrophota bacterium]
MHDLIIIGAGPAGLTAALYAGRYRLNSLILEKMAPGGQIILSSNIENFPGFPGGISTQELVERFKKQVGELGINIETEEVLTISSSSATFNIKTQGNSYQTKSIIIATGASAKRLGVKGEDEFIGRGVSYCATCDGPLFRNKDVAVIGGGDRAVEEAIFLSSYAKTVYLAHRRGELRASQILIEKAKSIPKINFILESIVEEIQGENKVEQVLLKNLKTNSQSKISCQGVFVFVGINPNTAFLKNLMEMDETGFIITDQEMKTSEGGIFACGDCRKKSLYQVITACGDGAVAAHSTHKYLINQNM